MLKDSFVYIMKLKPEVNSNSGISNFQQWQMIGLSSISYLKDETVTDRRRKSKSNLGLFSIRRLNWRHEASNFDAFLTLVCPIRLAQICSGGSTWGSRAPLLNACPPESPSWDPYAYMYFYCSTQLATNS